MSEPIPMIITCPACSGRHIDEGECATKPHHTHACQHCGTVWRPAIVDTVGVQFLPGYKQQDAIDRMTDDIEAARKLAQDALRELVEMRGAK